MVDLLRSPLLTAHGFAHGFSLRTGGDSVGAFAEANLGRGIGDDPDRIARHLEDVAAQLRVAPACLYEASQVHSARLIDVSTGPRRDAVRKMQADALLSQRPATAVGVRTADCVPVLLADRRTGDVAAVHAGWRGVATHIVTVAVYGLRARGSHPEDLLAAIGPHARAPEFEVGDDVAAEIQAAIPGEEIRVASGGRLSVDLARGIAAQLRDVGISPGSIEDIGGHTMREPARFFSHRADRGRTGRHLSAIAVRRPD